MSCWQIISFILPPSEYGCVGLLSTYRRRQFWQKKIIFSDEAHSDIVECVNNQNQKTRTHILQSRRTQNGSLFGAEFRTEGEKRREEGEAVPVNGDRYRATLNEFLFTKIEEEDIGNIWLRYVTHSRSYTRCFASCVWRSDYHSQS